MPRPFNIQRREMIKTQLAARGIKSKAVLKAFGSVPREIFVPENCLAEAYDDTPLPLMNGQTISQPYMVALMTEMLALPEGEQCRILEIGTGSGYQAAILAKMGHKITTVERLQEISDYAAERLSQLPYGKNVRLIVGDGSLGFGADAPYDGIIVTAAAPTIPEELIRQLKINKTLAIPCGEYYFQHLLKVSRISEEKIAVEQNCGCRFVPLIGAHGFKNY